MTLIYSSDANACKTREAWTLLYDNIDTGVPGHLLLYFTLCRNPMKPFEIIDCEHVAKITPRKDRKIIISMGPRHSRSKRHYKAKGDILEIIDCIVGVIKDNKGVLHKEIWTTTFGEYGPSLLIIPITWL